MRHRLMWITGGGVFILLLLLVVGYTQGWFGRIFGAALGDDYTATIDASNFRNEGTFDRVMIQDGALELKRLNEG
ncbi:hypothetical protein HY374_03885 [Candidatus Berkelbacteria bacterium]|nr:hypothetical protein [Candidatus Berkelbacteria bacterium]